MRVIRFVHCRLSNTVQSNRTKASNSANNSLAWLQAGCLCLVWPTIVANTGLVPALLISVVSSCFLLQWLEVLKMWPAGESVAKPDRWFCAVWKVVLWWQWGERACGGALQGDGLSLGSEVGNHHSWWSRSATWQVLRWGIFCAWD